MGEESVVPHPIQIEEEVSGLEIRSYQVAKNWTDALPIGNGRLGGMVWGGVPTEIINLNEDTIWTGAPDDYTDPEAPKHVARIRKLVHDKNFSEATQESYKLGGCDHAWYQLLGDLKIEFDNSHAGYNKDTYERNLDLDTATARVKYSVNEVEYTREYFASFPDQVIAAKISGNKPGSLNFTVFLDSKLQYESNVVSGKNQIVLNGKAPAKEGVEGLRFSALIDLNIAGSLATSTVIDGRKKIRVESSDSVIIYLVAATSFDGPFTKPADSKKDPSSDVLEMLASVKKHSYSELYSRHVDDYQKLYNRVSLKLSKGGLGTSNQQKKRVSTAERVNSFKTDGDPTLVELLFQFGRYLMIASSRPGTQPGNLQGIWNDSLRPAFDGNPHVNINLQMNYWPALPCNLAELQEPLFEHISDLSVNGSKTAKVNYEASGWVTHHTTDLWAKTSPFNGDPVWTVWPMGGAWLTTHLWEHYTYTLDKDFLEKKAYPIIEGCTAFLLDWLIEGPDGYLATCPATSPEHHFIAPDGKQASVSYSTTMDISIIREIFLSILSAAEVLGKAEDGILERVRKALPRLPPTKIASDGTIMEWPIEFEDHEVDHCHISHLFGLYPGHTITEKNPDLLEAAEKTLYRRGVEGPSWSTVWKMAVWAHLRNSERAYDMLKHLFYLVDPARDDYWEGGGLYTNLFGSHPPFQIDSNFGFTSGVAEMLVQSTVEDLYLLPALPRDKWPRGSVKGLRARGGVTLNVFWEGGKLREAVVWINNNKSLNKRIQYDGVTVNVELVPGVVYTFNEQLKLVHSN